ELEQLRLDSVRREQLQQRFRRTNVSTWIAANVQDETVLRKIRFRDQSGERLQESRRIVDGEAEETDIAQRLTVHGLLQCIQHVLDRPERGAIVARVQLLLDLEDARPFDVQRRPLPAVLR